MNARIKPEHLEELERAVIRLEKSGLAGRYSGLAGGGFDRAIAALPKPLKRRVNRSIEKSVAYCLRFIVRAPPQTKPRRPRRKVGLLLAGIGGGVGGALGLSGVFIELPVITILILRAIAETALYYGEDLSTLEGRLACVEVLALGARPAAGASRAGYFSTRGIGVLIVFSAKCTIYSSKINEIGVSILHVDAYFLHTHYTEQRMNINVDRVFERAMSVRMGGSLHRL